jgi:hypothetical protein
MNPERPESTYKRWARRLGKIAVLCVVVLLSSLVGLVLADLVVRVAAPQQLIQTRPDLWQSDDTVGWRRRPNVRGRINTGERTVTLITDADGNRIGIGGRTAAATQVLLLGDSFIEAAQVEHEQSLAYLLERGFSERLGWAVAVRNAGVAGWNPNHYLLRGRQLLQRETFALVIVGLFVGNDAVTYRFDRIPPRTATVRRPFRLPRALSWHEFMDAMIAPSNDCLESRSHLYVLAKNRLSTLRMRLGMTADYMPLEYRRDEASSPRWRNTAELSRDLAREAARYGVPVVFVLIPERFQVYDDEFRRYLHGFGIDSTAIDVDQPSRLLKKELTALGLRVVDALPTLRAASHSTERLYGTVDQHFSPRGHRALADLLLTELMPLLQR